MNLQIKRYNLINGFIKKYNYKSYLEIGICNPFDCFDLIDCENKTGVDPDPRINHYKRDNIIIETSDQFFEKNNKKFDIIFIDGLHLDHQVYKDIQNSLKSLNKNGTIILHDCHPTEEIHQAENWDIKKCQAWMGTTWKAFAKFIRDYPEYETYTIDSDCGLGVISNKKIEFKDEDLTYEFFDKNKKSIMKLLTVEGFLAKEKFEFINKNEQ